MNANPQRLYWQISSIVVFAQQSEMVVCGAELFVCPFFVAANCRLYTTGFHVGIRLSTQNAILNRMMQPIQIRDPTCFRCSTRGAR